MTAAQLAELNGLLALAAANRADAGDPREKEAIVDEILAEAGVQGAEALLDRVAALIGTPHGNPPARVLP